jgi:hypothetical protein
LDYYGNLPKSLFQKSLFHAQTWQKYLFFEKLRDNCVFTNIPYFGKNGFSPTIEEGNKVSPFLF